MMRQFAHSYPTGVSFGFKYSWPTILLFVGLALTTTGCGDGSRPNTAHLMGTVTIGGDALPANAQANLTFSPMSGGRTAGAVVTNGKYDCPDAPMGKVKVYAHILRKTGKMITESDGRPYAEVASIIAPKYSAGIDVEVTGDSSELDFDLEPAEQFAADN